MQNKSAIWVFTVLMILACLYQISFSWVTKSVENEAEEIAAVKLDSVLQVNPELAEGERDLAMKGFAADYLKGREDDAVYPFGLFTYQECKEQELNLGLDLQGGMNVTLEVSIPELLVNLTGNSDDPAFRKSISDAVLAQNTETEDFITLFERAYLKNAPQGQLIGVFHTIENKELFPFGSTNEQVIAQLRTEARSAIDNSERILRSRIDKFGVSQPNIQKQEYSGRILIELPGVKDKKRVRDLLQSTARLEFWETYGNQEVFDILFRADSVIKKVFFAKTDETKDSTKVEDKAATTAPTAGLDSAKEASADALLAELAGETKDTSASGEGDSTATDLTDVEADDKKPLFEIFQFALSQDAQGRTIAEQSARVGGCYAKDTALFNKWIGHKEVQRLFPRGMKLLWGTRFRESNYMPLYAIKVTTREGKPRLDGSFITDARQEFQQFTGNPEVALTMNDEGAKIWERMTEEIATQQGYISIVLDDVVYSAPSVRQKISGGNTSISGGFTVEEAEDLASILKAGALPAPSKIVQEVVVGPTLGAENIKKGIQSFIIAFLMVLAYMFFYYSRAGLVANVALIANIFFIVGALASLGATLTLPGIAGLVLTIGMSVDANVLIYERIREEIAAGKGMKLAVIDGYKRAYASIVDANVTTLLTAFVLAAFGTGPVQGFATILIIGIFTSLFSAIFITRLIFAWMLDRKMNVTFSTRMTENLFKNTNIQFIGRRKLFYGISSIIIILGVVSLFTRGLNAGVEFTGGRTYVVNFTDSKADISKVKTELGNVFISADNLKMVPEVKEFGQSSQVKITTKFRYDERGVEVDEAVESLLNQGLAKVEANYEIKESSRVDPSISADIKSSSIQAVGYALIIIFLYILLRFRKWQFGLAAVIATFHDVLVVLSVFSIAYGFLPFSLEIDQAFIAAILTVVGYSINDTVVVFDRIREFAFLHRKKDSKEVVNMALNSTLSRTINTSMSTFIVLLMIFILGGDSIKGFAFALMIGVFVGTYSSLFIASTSVVDMSKSITQQQPEA